MQLAKCLVVGLKVLLFAPKGIQSIMAEWSQRKCACLSAHLLVKYVASTIFAKLAYLMITSANDVKTPKDKL